MILQHERASVGIIVAISRILSHFEDRLGAIRLQAEGILRIYEWLYMQLSTVTSAKILRYSPVGSCKRLRGTLPVELLSPRRAWKHAGVAWCIQRAINARPDGRSEEHNIR